MIPLNLPNVLTLMRIVAVPVVVVALLDETPNGDTLAAIVFALAALTDGLDGYIARSRDSVTTFGKLMDPLADKLLITAALVSLVSLNRLQAWVAMVIIAREFAVTATRMAATQQGIVIAANWWGKAKTIVQVGVIFLLITFPDTPPWLEALVYVMVAITIVSGVDYFFGLRRLLREADESRAAKVAERLDRDAGGRGIGAGVGQRAHPQRQNLAVGIERQLGNPSATPMLVAAWQLHEVVKLLCGSGSLLRNRLLVIDAEFGEFTEILLVIGGQVGPGEVITQQPVEGKERRLVEAPGETGVVFFFHGAEQ